MTTDERWEALLNASKHVARAFKNGYHPTFEQLQKLDAAIYGVETLKLCGHRLIEECDCLELNGVFKAE